MISHFGHTGPTPRTHDRGLTARHFDKLKAEYTEALSVADVAAPARLACTNAYVIVAGSLHLSNHLAVRDILRADPVPRDAYGHLSKRIAATAKDIHEYVACKDTVVQQILEASGLTEQERASVLSLAGLPE